MLALASDARMYYNNDNNNKTNRQYNNSRERERDAIESDTDRLNKIL